MSDNSGCGCLIYTVLAIIAIVGAIFFTKWVVNSDLPLWLKVFILRR